MSLLSRMSALTALLLVSCMPLSAQPATERHVVEHVSPVAPESLDDLFSHAAIIVVARIITATPAPRTALGGVPDVYTTFSAGVTKTLKGNLPAGAVLLQKAGTATVDGITAEVAGEPVLQPGSRYVLFVNWNPTLQAFIVRGSEGAFRINGDGLIEPLGRSPFAASQRGRRESDFVRDVASRRELVK